MTIWSNNLHLYRLLLALKFEVVLPKPITGLMFKPEPPSSLFLGNDSSQLMLKLLWVNQARNKSFYVKKCFNKIKRMFIQECIV